MPCMPNERVRVRGANSSRAPRPILNQPRLRARRSGQLSELGPVSRTLGSPLERTIFERLVMTECPFLRLQHDFDAAVLLVSEHVVHLGSALQSDGVCDHK